MNNCFVIDRSKNYSKKNLQYAGCTKENVPLVWIRPRRKYARVEIDLLPTDRSHFDDLTIRNIVEIFEEYTESKNIIEGAISCIAEQIPMSCAEMVAERVYNVGFESMPRLRSIIQSYGN